MDQCCHLTGICHVAIAVGMEHTQGDAGICIHSINTSSSTACDMRQNIWQRINEGFHDMIYIWWMEMKNIIKDEGVLIFFILVPLLYPLLYSWIYNNEVVRNVPVAIVDKSHSASSREFIRKVDASPDVKVAYYCNSLNEAQNLIGQQKVKGVMYFPSDFETLIGRGEQAHVSVYCDMSLMLTYKAIYQTATAVSMDMGRRIQISKSNSFTSRDEEISTQPLAFEEVEIFNSTGGYGNAIIPSVLLLILQQTLLLGIGLSAGTARENNRFNNLIPASSHFDGVFRVILGKAMCYLMIYAVMGAYITLCVPRFFGFTSMISGTDHIGLMTPFILSCIFFGMMLSCLVRYRENVMLLVVFTSIPLLFLTGISWPQSNIPGYWQGFSWLFPSTFGVKGFLRLSSMGATLHDITTEYRALWIQVGVYFIATYMVYNYQIYKTRKTLRDHVNMMLEKIKRERAKKG